VLKAFRANLVVGGEVDVLNGGLLHFPRFYLFGLRFLLLGITGVCSGTQQRGSQQGRKQFLHREGS